MRKEKDHWWARGKAFRQGGQNWLPAKCGVGVAVAENSNRAMARVTCLRCAKLLGVKRTSRAGEE